MAAVFVAFSALILVWAPVNCYREDPEVHMDAVGKAIAFTHTHTLAFSLSRLDSADYVKRVPSGASLRHYL